MILMLSIKKKSAAINATLFLTSIHVLVVNTPNLFLMPLADCGHDVQLRDNQDYCGLMVFHSLTTILLSHLQNILVLPH